MINIGFISPNRNAVAPLYGTIPINATWDQYIPIVDENGVRIDLTDYSFELQFRPLNESTVELLLSTIGGTILKTTDADGDTLRIFAAPSVMSEMDGTYRCSFAARNGTQVWLLARGNVLFEDEPDTFTT